MRIIIGALALGLVGGACGKKSDGGGGGDLPAPVAAWLPAGALDAWQGVWETHLSLYDAKNLDTPIALEIKGDHATAWDGTKERQLAIKLESPCALGFVDKLENGGDATYTKFFLMQGGKIVAIGDGAAGYRKGKAAITCRIGSDGVTIVDDKGACQNWKPDFFGKKKDWEASPEMCAWSTKDGKDVLTVGSGGFSGELAADGDLLESDQLRREVKDQQYLKRAADYATAKTWVTAELAAKK